MTNSILCSTIAQTLKEALPSVSLDLALRYAERITIALYREGYLPTHDL
jgi:hypothetical protein